MYSWQGQFGTRHDDDDARPLLWQEHVTQRGEGALHRRRFAVRRRRSAVGNTNLEKFPNPLSPQPSRVLNFPTPPNTLNSFFNKNPLAFPLEGGRRV